MDGSTAVAVAATAADVPVRLKEMSNCQRRSISGNQVRLSTAVVEH